MNELLQGLYGLNLSSPEVEKIFLTIDEWLEGKYPFISELYRKQMLRELMEANRQKTANTVYHQERKAA